MIGYSKYVSTEITRESMKKFVSFELAGQEYYRQGTDKTQIVSPSMAEISRLCFTKELFKNFLSIQQ